jgi:hypothetical protein
MIDIDKDADVDLKLKGRILEDVSANPLVWPHRVRRRE